MTCRPGIAAHVWRTGSVTRMGKSSILKKWEEIEPLLDWV